MITTLTGTNSFLLKAELRTRVRAFVAEHTDMALEQLDAEDVEYDRIREAVESMPFLASRKLVVIRGGSANKVFTEHAPKLLEDVSETTDVIVVEPKLDKRSSYYKFLHKNTDYHEFAELDENGLTAWLVQQAKKAGGSLKAVDARYLVSRTGPQQQLLAQELDKLLLYDASITRETIDLLVEAAPQSSIFDLLEAAFGGRLQQAMKLYAEQRAARVEPQQILAMVAWQLHILAIVKAGQGKDPQIVAKDAKLNPYVVRKSSGVAGKIPGSRLKQLIHDALVLDVRLKSEALDADDALAQYIVQLAA